MNRQLLILLSSILIASCTIYRSPDRKDFESESPTFRVQSLKQTSCTQSSIRAKSQAQRLITVFQDPQSNESRYLWEYIIEDQSYFESDNLNGAYCAFENS